MTGITDYLTDYGIKNIWEGGTWVQALRTKKPQEMFSTVNSWRGDVTYNCFAILLALLFVQEHHRQCYVKVTTQSFQDFSYYVGHPISSSQAKGGKLGTAVRGKIIRIRNVNEIPFAYFFKELTENTMHFVHSSDSRALAKTFYWHNVLCA